MPTPYASTSPAISGPSASSAPARPTTSRADRERDRGRDLELAGRDRAVALGRVLAVELGVVGVVDQVAGRGDGAEGEEGDRGAEDRLRVVELAREQEAGEDEEVLDPLLRPHRLDGSPNRAAARLRMSPGAGDSSPAAGLSSVAPSIRSQGRLGVEQHPGVENALRVELLLGGAQGRGEGVGPLAVVPGPVVAADGVVVGDRAAGIDQRVGDGGLDLVPLLDLRARVAPARAP